MIITEEELRQAWQNGRGQIPAFPPGTRFTPAALDFLKAREPAVLQACSTPRPIQTATAGRELKAAPGQRLIFTTAEVADLIAEGGSTLVVHPSVTVTHAAQEKLRNAGVRVVPYVETSCTPPSVAPAVYPKVEKDEELFRKVKEAVLARLGKPVDQTVLDAVLRKVLAAL